MKFALICLFVTLLSCSDAAAQTVPAWGTASEIVYPILASDLRPLSSSTTYEKGASGIYLTTESARLWASVKVPTGDLAASGG